MGLINRLAEDRFFFFFASKSRIHINTVSCGNSWEVGDHQGSWLCFSFVSHLLSLAETSEPVDKGGRNHRAQVLRDCVHQAKQKSVKQGGAEIGGPSLRRSLEPPAGRLPAVTRSRPFSALHGPRGKWPPGPLLMPEVPVGVHPSY